MTAYRVVRPWHGVRVGDTVETKSLHPALAAHVLPVADAKRQAGEATLEVATPSAAAAVKKPRKKE